MSKSTLTIVAALLTFGATGETLVYDRFFDAATANLPSGWISSESNPVNNHGFVASGSLAFPGTASADNSFGLGQKTADYSVTFPAQSLTAGESLYFSFLIQLNTIDAFNTGAFRLWDSTDQYGNAIMVGLGTTDHTTDLMGFSINNRNKNWSSAESVNTSESYSIAGTTHLVVGGYTRGASGNGSGSVNLWINPAISATPGIPTVTMASYNEDEDYDTFEIISSGSGSFPSGWQLDELKIGTAWSDVVSATIPTPSVPVVIFNADPVSGNAPLGVTFTDTSSGGITNRYWDFGDGATTNITSTSISHIYATTGTYSVALTVSGAAGGDTNTQANLITVTDAPPVPVGYLMTSHNADTFIGLNDSGTPVIGWTGDDELNLGDNNAAFNKGDQCAVVMFQLPDLGGEAVSNANLSLNMTVSWPGGADPFPKGVDVYGVRYSSSPTVVAGDYGFKGSGAGSLIQSNVMNLPSNAIYDWQAYETDEFGDISLAVWLNDQITSGADAGDYVFFRYEPNGDTANPIFMASADDTDYAAPALSIYTGGEPPDPPPPLTNATVLAQHGITWILDGQPVTGQYANGDYWVVGPVDVVTVSNNFHIHGISPPVGQDGCMINPGTDTLQGYDSRLFNYDSSLNRSYPNGMAISPSNPLALGVNESLVSSVSWLYGEPGCPADGAAGGPRPSIRSMAILTCVDSAPPAGSFRPPYCGTDKSPGFNVSQLDASKLADMDPVARMPVLAEVEEHFDGPWVDHVNTWVGGMTHPSEHMPNYGREIALQIGEAALLLQVDFSQLSGSPTKDLLLMRFTQLGIDLAGIADHGGGWPHDGGHAAGRKLPILLAGVVLDDAHMKNIGAWTTDFQEDMDTFYVSQAEIDYTHDPAWNPDIRADEEWPYEAANIGLPEWGIRHEREPLRDQLHWSATYRDNNNRQYPALALTTLLMGQRATWNHEPFFDYTDRAVAVGPYQYQTDTYRYGGLFTADMWRAYRANHPPQWVPYDDTDYYSLGEQYAPKTGFYFSLKAFTPNARYVGGVNANDSNDGSQAAPWATLAHAASQVDPGDTVIVAPGNYDETLTLNRGGTAGRPVVFRSETVHGARVNSFRVQTDHVTIDGFEVTNNETAIYNAFGIHCGEAQRGNARKGCRIINNLIHDLNGTAILGGEEALVKGNTIRNVNKGIFINSDSLVEGNEVDRIIFPAGATSTNKTQYSFFCGDNITFRGNYFHGTPMAEAKALRLDFFTTYDSGSYTSSHHIVIEDNVCFNATHGCEPTGTALQDSSHITFRNNLFVDTIFVGIYCQKFSDIVIENNTFINCGAYPVWFQHPRETQGTVVRNNIMATWDHDPENYGGLAAESGIRVDNTAWIDTYGTVIDYNMMDEYLNRGYGSNDFAAVPAFVDPDNGNFRLQAGSPGIDAGTNTGISTDQDGNPRPQGATYDVGSYEQ